MDDIILRPQALNRMPPASYGGAWTEEGLTDAFLPLDDEDGVFGAVGADEQIIRGLGGVLGDVLGAGAGEVAQDPNVQLLVQGAAETCRDRAKEGVGEWVVENRQALMIGGAATLGVLLIGHFILSVTALSLAFPRAFKG